MKSLTPPSVWTLLSTTFIVVCCGLLSYLLVEGAWTSITLAIGALIVLRVQVLFAKLGSIRRLMLFLLFMCCSLDITKAIVPPLEQFYSPGLYVSVAQAILILWTVLWMGERLLVERRGLPVTRLDLLALGFLVWNWIAAFYSPAGDLAIASAVAYTLCVLGFYVVSHSITDVQDLRLALRGLVFTFLAQAGFSFAQMIIRGPIPVPGLKVFSMASMNVGYGDTSAFRPFGLFDHPNTMADYVLWLILPALAMVLMGRRHIAKAVWWWSLFVLVVGTSMLLASLSRGGWAAMGLGVIVLAWMYTRLNLLTRRHYVIAALLVVAALLAVAIVYPQVFLRLTEPDARSLESRILLNDQAFKIIDQNWLFGVGLGGYNWSAPSHIPSSWADVSPDYHKMLLQLVVHNSYLLTAAELGIPGAVAWLVVLLAMMKQAWPLTQWKHPALLALGAGLGAAMAAHILYLASDNYYIDIRIFMLWISGGLLQALKLMAASPQAPRVTARATEAACR